MWDEITDPFPNFHGAVVEVCKWISNFILRFILYAITNPCIQLRAHKPFMKRVPGKLSTEATDRTRITWITRIISVFSVHKYSHSSIRGYVSPRVILVTLFNMHNQIAWSCLSRHIFLIAQNKKKCVFRVVDWQKALHWYFTYHTSQYFGYERWNRFHKRRPCCCLSVCGLFIRLLSLPTDCWNWPTENYSVHTARLMRKVVA